MRYPHLILIGIAIPMLLTATVFAAPGRAGMFAAQVNDATHLHSSDNNQPGLAGRLIATAEATTHDTHYITLVAERISSNGLLAYRMDSHEIDAGSDGINDIDLGSNYPDSPTIPGPTIVLKETDEVFLTIENEINGITGDEDNLVSVHVHGVHYEITSDGTLEHINNIGDQGAYPEGGPVTSFTYHWIAGPGTAGTWPYHDHTWGGLNGAEHKGLFGTVIVNPVTEEVEAVNDNTVESINIAEIDKEFVIYVGDDAFWGQEIASDGEQTPLWTNPTLGAKTGDYVRFHLIALGTDAVHTFRLGSYKWLDPGTDDLINSKDIGPLENHQFTIKTEEGNTSYMDNNISNKLMGMQGKFKVTDSGADSIPSQVPELF